MNTNLTIIYVDFPAEQPRGQQPCLAPNAIALSVIIRTYTRGKNKRTSANPRRKLAGGTHGKLAHRICSFSTRSISFVAISVIDGSLNCRSSVTLLVDLLFQNA